MLAVCKVGALAQPDCWPVLEVSLEPFSGMANLSVADFLMSDPGLDATVSQSQFSCEDVGQDITVVVTEGSASCTTVVSVIDAAPPVAVGEIAVSVEIPEGFEALILNPALIDDGSYDNCGEVTLSTDPEYITCEMIGGTINVVLTVTDESGNTNSVITMVTVEGPDVEQSACLGDFDLKILGPHFVNKNMIHTNFTPCYESTMTCLLYTSPSPRD